MAVEIRQLKDKGTNQEFVPVTTWEAIGNKPDVINNIDSNNSYAFIAKNNNSNVFAIDLSGNLVLFDNGSPVVLTPSKLSLLIA